MQKPVWSPQRSGLTASGLTPETVNQLNQDLHKQAYKIGLKCYTFSELGHKDPVKPPK